MRGLLVKEIKPGMIYRCALSNRRVLCVSSIPKEMVDQEGNTTKYLEVRCLVYNNKSGAYQDFYPQDYLLIGI